jgi:hypothetical protein
MNTPEPLDEVPAIPAETRGGDHLADILAPKISLEGTVTRPDISAMAHTQNADGSFCCDEDDEGPE